MADGQRPVFLIGRRKCRSRERWRARLVTACARPTLGAHHEALSFSQRRFSELSLLSPCVVPPRLSSSAVRRRKPRGYSSVLGTGADLRLCAGIPAGEPRVREAPWEGATMTRSSALTQLRSLRRPGVGRLACLLLVGLSALWYLRDVRQRWWSRRGFLRSRRVIGPGRLRAGPNAGLGCAHVGLPVERRAERGHDIRIGSIAPARAGTAPALRVEGINRPHRSLGNSLRHSRVRRCTARRPDKEIR